MKQVPRPRARDRPCAPVFLVDEGLRRRVRLGSSNFFTMLGPHAYSFRRVEFVRSEPDASLSGVIPRPRARRNRAMLCSLLPVVVEMSPSHALTVSGQTKRLHNLAQLAWRFCVPPYFTDQRRQIGCAVMPDELPGNGGHTARAVHLLRLISCMGEFRDPICASRRPWRSGNSDGGISPRTSRRMEERHGYRPNGALPDRRVAPVGYRAQERRDADADEKMLVKVMGC